jgi:hypothetical protein
MLSGLRAARPQIRGNSASAAPAARLYEQHSPEEQAELAEFTVGYANGFLPRHDPLAELPSRFALMEVSE